MNCFSITEEPTPKVVLPKPNFGDADNESTKSSVFKNPFIEAENEKEAILQKHVKMVDTKDNVMVINGACLADKVLWNGLMIVSIVGKKICWNYRKGRCRFGHNCKFAHDSDIQKSKEQLDAEKQVQNVVVCQNQTVPQPSTEELEKIKEESVGHNQQKRKRPGLTQGLVPGKKVMKNYVKYK